MIRLKYLPANQEWVFLFGEDINTASILPMDGKLFFKSRKEAVWYANGVGLIVAEDGTVSNCPIMNG